jgi:hypothetical protein
MIRIVSTVCSQIKCDREPFLSGCKIATIKGIGVLRSREPGILTNGPWSTVLSSREEVLGIRLHVLLVGEQEHHARGVPKAAWKNLES